MKFEINDIVDFLDSRDNTNSGNNTKYKIVSRKIVYRLQGFENEDYGYTEVDERLLKKYEGEI